MASLHGATVELVFRGTVSGTIVGPPGHNMESEPACCQCIKKSEQPNTRTPDINNTNNEECENNLPETQSPCKGGTMRKACKKTWKLETEEERRKRLDYAKLKNQRYRERHPQKYLEVRKRNSQHFRKERKFNETPEERQWRLKKMREYYYKRRANMTLEQLEEVRRKDRERWHMVSEEQRQKKLEVQRTYRRRKLTVNTKEEQEKRQEKQLLYYDSRAEKIVSERTGNSVQYPESTTKPTYSSPGLNSEGKAIASRSTKTMVKEKIRQLMVNDSKDSTMKPLKSDNELEAKWGLKKLVVVLERIDARDFNHNVRINDHPMDRNIPGRNCSSDTDIEKVNESKSSEEEKKLKTDKWNLRPLAVRLERIDVTKAMDDITSQF